MAWITVQLIEDEFTDNAESGGSASVKYYCEADAATTCDAAIGASVSGGGAVPALKTAYSVGWPFCTVKSHKVERLSATQFRVGVEYASPTGGAAATNDTDLLLLPAKIKRSAEEYQEAFEKDVNGKIVRNSAGDRFDHLPERMTGVGIFSIQKYVNATGRAAIDAAWNTVNSGSVTIDGVSCAAETCWLVSPVYEPVDGSTGVFSANFVVKYKKAGWKIKVCDYGYRELVDGKPGRIMEQPLKSDGTLDTDPRNARPSTLPWPLNGSGMKKANQTDDPFDIEFVPIVSASWASLPLA